MYALRARMILLVYGILEVLAVPPFPDSGARIDHWLLPRDMQLEQECFRHLPNRLRRRRIPLLPG